MSVIDDIREMLGQFRAGVTELAEADRKQLAELQRLRITTAQQADTIDEQREIIARLTAELEKERATDKQCRECGADLLFSARRRGNGLCGPCTRTLDITELRAMLERRYKEQPEEMGDLLDALYTAIERTRPARPGQLVVRAAGNIEQGMMVAEVAQLGAERQRRYEVEQELSRVREELATLPAITAHVRTLLGILDATGGYMPSDYQAAIRAAREAVGRG